MITIQRLIELLEACGDKSRVVILSSDPEGNDYGPLTEDGLSFGAYRDGEVRLEELTEAHIKDGYTEEDLFEEGTAVKALVLYP